MSKRANARRHILCLAPAPAARAALDLKIDYPGTGAVAARLPACLRLEAP